MDKQTLIGLKNDRPLKFSADASQDRSHTLLPEVLQGLCLGFRGKVWVGLRDHDLELRISCVWKKC